MTVEAVCFDLDDTLYDYEQYARAGLWSAAEHLEKRTGKRLHEELRSLYFDDEVTEGTFDVLVSRHDLSPDLVDELVEAFHNATTSLTPYPSTEPVLTQLSERYQLGLLTDGRGGHAKLDRLGIEEYFDAVLVTPTIDRSKHDPVPFDRLLSALSLPANAAVYVGDDPRVDFRIPNELGMSTVRLRRGRHESLEPDRAQARADHQIGTLKNLPRVVKQCRRS